MEEKIEKKENESPHPQIDPESIRDDSEIFLPPVENGDDRLDFYVMYRKAASRYDIDYIKRRHEDLNTVLIFAGLLCAISAAFIIDMHPMLEPDPTRDPIALLLAIFLALDKHSILDEVPSDVLASSDPPTTISIAALVLYGSLMSSLLAAFTALLEKLQLYLYLPYTSGLTIGDCRDRQQRYDNLQTFTLFSFTSLSHQLIHSLLLLACGLCTRVAYIFGIGGASLALWLIVGAATYYQCNFRLPKPPSRIPVSTTSRSSRKIGSHITAPLRNIVAAGISLYKRLLPVQIGRHSHDLSLPTVRPTPQEPTSQLAHPHVPLENIQNKPSRVAPRPPSPNPTVTPPWLTPTALAALRETNATDVRCVSWTLWKINNPEELDVTIRHAGTIRWFEDGLDVEPPYKLIVSTFKASFDPTGKISPGSRDRAYYSGRVILWIHVRAMCRSEEFALKYPLPTIPCGTTSIDDDLRDLFEVYHGLDKTPGTFAWVYTALPQVTPAHQRWVWDVLLHTSWARRRAPDTFDSITSCHARVDWSAVPLDASFDCLLTWCIFLGCPLDAGNTVENVDAGNAVDVGNVVDAVDEVVLRVRNKSDHSEQVISQLSQAIVSAIRTSHPRCDLLPYMLLDLSEWEQRPSCLTAAAYEWCSVICENYPSLVDGKNFLFLSLEIGFRHLDPQHPQPLTKLTHTEHHQYMVDIVFDSQDEEVTADLLHAWTSRDDSNEPPSSLGVYARHLIGLRPSSQRLRRLVLRAVGTIGYQGFEQVGVEEFFKLLDHLQASVEDMDDKESWAALLLDTIQSPDDVPPLPHLYWESLAELSVSESQRLEGVALSQRVVESLKSNREWDKLEAWMGIVWMVWPPKTGSTEEKATLPLFRQRPGAIQKLEQWIERWGERRGETVPESFKQICERARREAAQ